MFKTNVDKIISQFNKMIAELDTLVVNLTKENEELDLRIEKNQSEMNKAAKVSNKLKEIVQ